MALSGSATADAVHYCRSRLASWRVVALWLLVTGALQIASPPASLTELLWSAGLLALGIGSLRIWDDLANRDHDRLYHPERVLVSSVSLWPFVIPMVAAMLLVALALVSEGRRLLVYAGLLIGLGLLYHTRTARRLPQVARVFIVLTKYPVMLFVAGAESSWHATLTGIALYGILAVHEWLDDSNLRAMASRNEVGLGLILGTTIVCAVFLWG